MFYIAITVLRDMFVENYFQYCDFVMYLREHFGELKDKDSRKNKEKSVPVKKFEWAEE
jgi:hypothetical protein